MTQDRPNREQRRRAARSQPPVSRGHVPETGTSEVRYLRSNLARVIHVDGGFGGLTPQGTIHLALYAERTDDAELSEIDFDAASRTARERLQARPLGPGGGWTREIEANLIMSREAARAIRDWLSRRLQEADNVESAISFKNLTDSEEPNA